MCQSAWAQDGAQLLTDEQRGDLDYHASNLASPAQTAANRARAARYLIRMRARQADDVLDASLRSGDGEQVRAVLAALEAEPVVPIDLIPTLVAILQGSADDARIQAIGRICAKVGEPGASRVAAIALGEAHPIPERTAAVRVLGEMRGIAVVQTAVATLIDLVTHAELAPVAFAGLETLTGRTDHGTDAAHWTAWWEDTKDQPPSDWMPDRVERVTVLEQENETLRDQAGVLQRRLDEFMNALYFSLLRESEDAMFTELAKWIRDDFLPVRRNAIARADSRVANAQRLSPAIHDALKERVVDDPAPDLRRRAARILDVENVAGIELLVVEALTEDAAAESRTVYLGILERRPTVQAVDPLISLLKGGPGRDRIAGVLLACINAHELEAETLENARAAARSAFANDVSVAGVRLIARVGDASDRSALEQYLAHDQPEIRAAVAESLRAHEPSYGSIVAHLADPAVYPTAIAITAQQADAALAGLDQVLALPPPEGTETHAWLNALRSVCDRLPPDQLGGADQRLRAIAESTAPADAVLQLREQVLARAMHLPTDALAPEDRVGLLLGLARVRSELERHADVLAAIDAATADGNGNQTNGTGQALLAELQRLRFSTLLTLGRFDDAQAVMGDAGAWLAELEGRIASDPDAAATLRTEIEARFPQMEEPLREQFDRLAARIDGGDGGGAEDASSNSEGTQDE